jgi:excisionase family DNA binding protein
MTATQPDSIDALPRLLNITDLAGHLGVNVRHIRRLVHERRIPFIKWGHLIRFDPDEVSAWIDANRQHAGAPRPASPRGRAPSARPRQAGPASSSADSGRLPLGP